VREPSEELSLLVAVLDGGVVPQHVADVEIEYDSGPQSVQALWSPNDVVSYADTAAQSNFAWRGKGSQKLSKVTVTLDNRTPRYLWVADFSDPTHKSGNHSVTEFAITQTTRR
jgi:hypothetical protein